MDFFNDKSRGVPSPEIEKVEPAFTPFDFSALPAIREDYKLPIRPVYKTWRSEDMIKTNCRGIYCDPSKTYACEKGSRLPRVFRNLLLCRLKQFQTRPRRLRVRWKYVIPKKVFQVRMASSWPNTLGQCVWGLFCACWFHGSTPTSSQSLIQESTMDRDVPGCSTMDSRYGRNSTKASRSTYGSMNSWSSVLVARENL